MLLAYVSDPAFRAPMEDLARTSLVTSRWDRFEELSGRALQMVLMIEWLKDWPHLRALRRLQVLRDQPTLVVVTRPVWDNAVLVAPIRLDALLDWDEVGLLPEVLRRARTDAPRLRAARVVRRRHDTGAKECHLLQALFTAPRPPRTCAEWAEAAHCSVSTLHYTLRKRIAPVDVTAGVLLRLNLLLSAVEQAPRARTFAALAAGIDVDRRTLQRAAAEFIGHRTDTVAPGADDLVAAFARRLSARPPERNGG